MGIPQKLGVTLTITVTGGQCTTYEKIQLTIKQKANEFVFDPIVIDDETLAITITDEQAKQFGRTNLHWQIIAKDADGANLYTPIYSASVDEIIGGGWDE